MEPGPAHRLRSDQDVEYSTRILAGDTGRGRRSDADRSGGRFGQHPAGHASRMTRLASVRWSHVSTLLLLLYWAALMCGNSSSRLIRFRPTPVSDKSLHFMAFFGLGFLLAWTWTTRRPFLPAEPSSPCWSPWSMRPSTKSRRPSFPVASRMWSTGTTMWPARSQARRSSARSTRSSDESSGKRQRC